MLYTKEQVINGITSYIDAEVMNKLPTAGKWIAGTAVTLAAQNANGIADNLINSGAVKMLGVVNNDGLIDVDKLTEAMKEAAKRYGNVTLSYPIIGNLTFTPNDIDLLRRYL